MQDIDKAIVLDREALSLRPQGHPDRPVSLNNLGAHLFIRYDQLGAMQDLDGDIVLPQEALTLFPQGRPDRSPQNLVEHPGYRYFLFRQLRVLERKQNEHCEK